MKRLLFTFSIAFSILNSTAQTAVNFNVADCASNNHNLFNECNAGKVIVITWVMPCGTCIGPALSAASEIQNYSSSNPGKIYHYVVDDYANTSCGTLNSWCTNNGLSPTAVFSNASISMSDYGTDGMPKTVIIAGENHTVFFNENNNLNTSNFNAAMNNALQAANAVGIKEYTNDVYQTSISPNPASGQITLSYTLKENKKVVIEIYNSLGQKVRTLNDTKASIGKNSIKIETSDLSNGSYFFKINDTGSARFVVSH
jgi:hypothetical protein